MPGTVHTGTGKSTSAPAAPPGRREKLVPPLSPSLSAPHALRLRFRPAPPTRCACTYNLLVSRGAPKRSFCLGYVTRIQTRWCPPPHLLHPRAVGERMRTLVCLLIGMGVVVYQKQTNNQTNRHTNKQTITVLLLVYMSHSYYYVTTSL